MWRICYFFPFFFMISAKGQPADSLFVVENQRSWLLIHKVQEGETVFSIARRYHVPPAILASENQVSYQTDLKPGKKLYVPTGAYNFIHNKDASAGQGTRPVYHRVDEEESLYRIARTSGVTQKKIQEWNGLEYPEISAGRRLLVGWIRYDATNMKEVKKNNMTVSYGQDLSAPDARETAVRGIPQSPPGAGTKKDSLPAAVIPPVKESLPPAPAWDSFSHFQPSDTLTEAGRVYLSQTYNGQSFTEEKGPAAFYDHKGASQVYYAFHNTAARGTIIKVINTGNGKYVFAKVLGPIPKTKLYHNCVIGISGNAKRELGVMGNKVWCSIQYAP